MLADDTNLSYSNEDINTLKILKIANEELNEIKEWF